jgi:hypothetical protein
MPSAAFLSVPPVGIIPTGRELSTRQVSSQIFRVGMHDVLFSNHRSYSTFYTIPSVLTVEGRLKAVAARPQLRFCSNFAGIYPSGVADTTGKTLELF